jgi:predicted PurR-regulated permease PerM
MVDEHKWTIDRKIPITLIVTFIGALFVQTIAGVTYVNALSNTLTQAVKDITRLEGRLQAQESKSLALQESLIRLEEHSKQQTKMLERILNSIETRKALPQ